MCHRAGRNKQGSVEWIFAENLYEFYMTFASDNIKIIYYFDYNWDDFEDFISFSIP